MSQELRARVRSAVDSLPDARSKEVILMHFGFDPYNEELGSTEIAKRLGVDERSARRIIQQALTRLSNLPELRKAISKVRMAHLLREARKVALIFGDPIPMMDVPLSVPAEPVMV